MFIFVPTSFVGIIAQQLIAFIPLSDRFIEAHIEKSPVSRKHEGLLQFSNTIPANRSSSAAGRNAGRRSTPRMQTAVRKTTQIGKSTTKACNYAGFLYSFSFSI